jgi:hypothetical protein
MAHLILTLISFRSLQRRFRYFAVAPIIATLSMSTPTRNDLCMSKSYLFLLVFAKQLFDNLTLASGDSHYTYKFIDKTVPQWW